MDILEKIVHHKKKEVAVRKEQCPVYRLEERVDLDRSCISMRKALLKKNPVSIIAEFKRKSPSKGIINNQVSVEEVTTAYSHAGVAGISILTDQEFFGGTLEDLEKGRYSVDVPLLRKDFIVDEYQILEAKASGADLILLIAETLTASEIRHFTDFAHNLKLEALLELHSELELSKIYPELDIVGINNRDLKTFQVDLDASIRLLQKLDGPFLKISESGLSDPEVVVKLIQAGFQGFLVGENFMKEADPGRACATFIRNIQELISRS